MPTSYLHIPAAEACFNMNYYSSMDSTACLCSQAMIVAI